MVTPKQTKIKRACAVGEGRRRLERITGLARSRMKRYSRDVMRGASHPNLFTLCKEFSPLMNGGRIYPARPLDSQRAFETFKHKTFLKSRERQFLHSLCTFFLGALVHLFINAVI